MNLTSYAPIAFLTVLMAIAALSMPPEARVAEVRASSLIHFADNHVALYRLNHAGNGDHLYTQTCNERNSLIKNSGYKYEGITGYIAASQLPNTVALYRLRLRSGYHFYTNSEEEARVVGQAPGNTLEGIAGYIASSQLPSTVPFYRLRTSDRHFYTATEGEKDKYLQSGGNILEGIMGYVWQSGLSPCDEGLLIQKDGKAGIWRVENGEKRLFPDTCTYRAMSEGGELGEKYVYTFYDHIIDAIPNGEPFPRRPYTCNDAPCCTPPGGGSGGDEITVQEICAGPIPTGWIRVNHNWIPTRCGNPSVITYNVWTIRRYDNMAKGSVIEACIGEVPPGWQAFHFEWIPTKCPGGAPQTNNVMRIRKIN